MAITFKEYPASYAKGRRVNAEEWNGFSRSLQGTDPVGFGVPVIQHPTDNSCAPLTATGQDVLGITEADLTLPHPGDEYQQYDTVAICESGVLGVVADEAVSKGAPARWNLTTKRWTDAAASATVLSIPGATFDTAGSAADEIVLLRYRRPNPSLSAGA